MNTLKLIMLTAIVSIGLLGSALADGGKVVVDLTQIDPEIAKQLIAAQQRAASSAGTPEAAHAWAGVGKEVAEALSATAKGLSLEVNDFVKTPVGWWAMFLIIWLLLGTKLVKLVIALLLLGVAIRLWFASMKRFFWCDPPYNFYSSEGRGACAFGHAIGVGILFVMIMLTIFGIF